MNKISTQKLIASITLFSFVFSTILFPIETIFAAGPYEPNYGIDLSDYKPGAGNDSTGGNTTGNTTGTNKDLTSTWYNPGPGGDNTYKMNISTIGEAIPAVIGCSGIVNKVNKSLTNLLSPGDQRHTPTATELKAAEEKKVTQVDKDINLDPKKNANINYGFSSYDAGAGDPRNANNYDDSAKGAEALKTGSSTSILGDAVPTYDAKSWAQLDDIKEKEDAIKKEAEQTRLRSECIDGVAYALAKGQLAKMTQSTVNWINSGFNGDPLYIRDRESYFQSIADGQITSLIGPLSRIENRYIYPFGRSLAKSIINTRKSTYEGRSQSTLSNSLQEGATTEDFANDFSTGGWNGWFSMTQNDANNPLGFGIMTSQELADRIVEKEENARAELTEGKGFLSQKKCLEYARNYEGKECTRWETTTPGSIIQEQASTTLTSNTRQLELADSLNESLSRVFEALVNQMVHQGLSSLSSFAVQNSRSTGQESGMGGYGSNRVYDSIGNDITGLSGSMGSDGNVLSVNQGRGWYNAGGKFDITTDLGDIKKMGADKKLYVYKKGIITQQKEYIEAVKLSMVEVPKIVPALGELDYCIPGPNPNWEEPLRQKINLNIEMLQSLNIDSSGKITSIYGTLDQLNEKLAQSQKVGFGEQVAYSVPLIGGVVSAIGNKSRQKKAEEYEKAIAKAEAEAQANEELFEMQKSESIRRLTDTFFKYKSDIEKYYGEESLMRNSSPTNKFYLPMVEAGLQATRYLRVYNENTIEAMDDYKSLINQTNANINKLEVIKKEVDKIVSAARKRRADEFRKNSALGLINTSCLPSNLEDILYDANDPRNKFREIDAKLQSGPATQGGTAIPNQAGNPTGTQNPTATSGAGTQGGGTVGAANPNATSGAATQGGGVVNATSPITPKFDVTIKENKLTCEATITAVNKSTGNIAGNAWGIKILPNPTVYSKTTKNLSNTFSTATQSGLATVTLTIKGADGKTNSTSKNVTIPKRTLNSIGFKCPQ